MERNIENVKITPYNFDEVVNKEITAEKFIKRMIKHCTYLLEENALPNNSIRYNNFKVLNELKDAIPHIKSLNNISKYQEVECEKLIQTTVEDIPFVGIVDKIMHYKNNIVIIDYKTGTPDVDLRLAKYGLNLQLPTYAYLIKTLYPNSNIVGIYLEHILKPNINYDLNKSEQNQYENHLKLQGYSIDNEDLISELDPTYLNSDYIKGMKMTSNGFARTAKLLNKDNFEKLKDITEEKIKECIK